MLQKAKTLTKAVANKDCKIMVIPFPSGKPTQINISVGEEFAITSQRSHCLLLNDKYIVYKQELVNFDIS